MQVDVDNLAVIYMTTEVNRERIDQDPPQLPFEPDNAMAEQNLRDSIKAAAFQFDYYKDIIQCSILWQGRYYHYMYCDDHEIPNRNLDSDRRKIHVVDFEKNLVCEVSELINTMFPTAKGGYPLGGGVVAGWELRTKTWPMLTNKAFGYGCITSKTVLTDPMKQYTTVNCLLDISTIYTQGASPAIRRLPSLADTLKYWGFTDIEFPLPGEIKEGICRDPIIAAHKIELYLLAMEGVVRQYCGYEMRDEIHPLVKEVLNAQKRNGNETTNS